MAAYENLRVTRKGAIKKGAELTRQSQLHAPQHKTPQIIKKKGAKAIISNNVQQVKPCCLCFRQAPGSRRG